MDNFDNMNAPAPGDNDPDFDESAGNNNTNDGIQESENHQVKRQVRKDRMESAREAAARLEGILEDVKSTTKQLLSEMNGFMNTTEGIEVDYVAVQTSQHQERARLADVESDVTGLTSGVLFRSSNELQQANE